MRFHTKLILIFVIIINLVAGVGYFFLFNYIKTDSETASSLLSSIDSSAKKDSSLKALRSVIKDTQTQRDLLSTFFLSPDSEVFFIEQIENLATSSGLTVKTKNVSSVVGPTPTTKTFQIEESVSGSWNDIVYFMNYIENLPYDIHIQNMSLSQQVTASAPIIKGKKTSSKNQSILWTGVFDINVTESK